MRVPPALLTFCLAACTTGETMPADTEGPAAPDDPAGVTGATRDSADFEDSSTGEGTSPPDAETDSGQTTGSTGPAVIVDANCIDGAYLLDPPELVMGADALEPIDDLVGTYSPTDYYSFMLGVLERRFPTGKRILELGGVEEVNKWIDDSSIATPSDVFAALPRVVHDVGHAIDAGLGEPDKPYYLAYTLEGRDLWLRGTGMHGRFETSSSPMYSLERGWLLDDEENAKRPPRCQPGVVFVGECGDDGEYGVDEFVAWGYLQGNLEDETPDPGDQGFNMLVEEMHQYTNSVAVFHAFTDYVTGASTLRHTMMTFMWWNLRFLRKIRLEQPEQWSFVVEDPRWRETLLTMWGRAWLYLGTGVPGVQPDVDQLHDLLANPDLLDELQRVREAHGCTDPQEAVPDFSRAPANQSPLSG